MSASAFLISLGQCLATMNLYAEGHPARERALDASFERLQELQAAGGPLEFSFVGGETIVGQLPVPELASWDWGARLAAVGVERIEIAGPVSREMYDRFVDEVWHRVTGRPDATAEARQMAPQAMRWGPLAVRRSAVPGAADAAADGSARARGGRVRSLARRRGGHGAVAARRGGAARVAADGGGGGGGAVALARDAERAADDAAAARPQALRPVHHHARLQRLGARDGAGGAAGAGPAGGAELRRGGAAARHRARRASRTRSW